MMSSTLTSSAFSSSGMRSSTRSSSMSRSFHDFQSGFTDLVRSRVRSGSSGQLGNDSANAFHAFANAEMSKSFSNNGPSAARSGSCGAVATMNRACTGAPSEKIGRFLSPGSSKDWRNRKAQFMNPSAGGGVGLGVAPAVHAPRSGFAMPISSSRATFDRRPGAS